MSRRGGAIIPGLLLILLGGWLLAQNLGLKLPGMDALWPVFPLLFGVGLLVQYFTGERGDDGQVFLGVAAALLGGFFFVITLGPLAWEDMDRYWPVIVLIVGLAFLAQWLVRPGQRGRLIPAGLALLVGGIGLALTLGPFSPEVVRQVVQLWPLLLVLAGLGVIANYLLRGNRSE